MIKKKHVGTQKTFKQKVFLEISCVVLRSKTACE